MELLGLCRELRQASSGYVESSGRTAPGTLGVSEWLLGGGWGLGLGGGGGVLVGCSGRAAGVTIELLGAGRAGHVTLASLRLPLSELLRAMGGKADMLDAPLRLRHARGHVLAEVRVDSHEPGEVSMDLQ